ncbi:MAG: co-chaperone YbbN [Paracoccaceae bacterium]|nr:MAG: co-chaperone YbbN [Paracoccaceae bacterium]
MLIEGGKDATRAKTDPVVEGSEASFMADVIEASREVPVIVDFWAQWCGPCRTLGPALEAAVRAQNGRVRMVKIDVDRNQRLAQQMRIQSIPAVFAFIDGRPVDGFMGAQPPAQIRQFVERIVAMAGTGDGLEQALAAAEAMLEEGAAADAAQTFAAILEEEPGNPRALAGLARAHLALGDTARAGQILGMVPAEKRNDRHVVAAQAELDLLNQGAEAGEIGELRARVARDPADLGAKFDLAVALAGNRRAEEAIELLLEIIRRDRDWNEGAAKTQLFKLFDMLGPSHPLTLKGRRRLSSVLFA